MPSHAVTSGLHDPAAPWGAVPVLKRSVFFSLGGVVVSLAAWKASVLVTVLHAFVLYCCSTT